LRPIRVYKRGCPWETQLRFFVRFWRFQNWCFQNSLTNVFHHVVEISRTTADGPGAWNSKANRKHKTIPNVTPTRVITASMPSYTRYLNPHGSLVSRRWDLVKATQPIPVSKLRVVSYDPFTGNAVRHPYLSATPLLVHPIELYHYTSITSVFTDRLRDGLLARVTLFEYPSMGNHLMTSISVSPAWLNIFLFETTLVLWRVTSSNQTDLTNRVAIALLA